jgi:hypothetical protein
MELSQQSLQYVQKTKRNLRDFSSLGEWMTGPESADGVIVEGA